MPDTIDAEWIAITRLGARYEEETDVRANPNAPDHARYRHREVCFTGDVEYDWMPGPAPK